jgi:hypothetical protein
MIRFSKKTSTDAKTDKDADIPLGARPTEHPPEENRFEQIRRKVAEGHGKSGTDGDLRKERTVKDYRRA